MSGLDNAFNMYMQFKGMKRQNRLDELNEQKFKYQQEENTLANARMDAQAKRDSSRLAIQQKEEARAAEIHQANLEGKNLANQEAEFALLAKQGEQLSHRIATNGAAATYADDTYRPVLNKFVGQALRAAGMLPEGITFAGFEEFDMDGPSQDGSSNRYFVPMVQDAEGNQTELGAFLNNGDQAMAFSDEQVGDFIQNITQQYQGATTDMGVSAMVEANTDDPNAGVEVNPVPQNLATQATTTTPAEATPLVEQETAVIRDPLPDEVAPEGTVEVSAIEDDAVEPAQTSDEIVADLVDEVTDQYSQNVQSLAGHTSNEVAIEKKLLQDVMTATGLTQIDAEKAIQNYRVPAERNDSLATNIGQGARNVVDAVVDVGQWADDQITTDNGRRKKMTDFVDEVVKGFNGDIGKIDTSKDAPALAGNQGSQSDRAVKTQTEALKQNPPAAKETDVVVGSTVQMAQEATQNPRKRPTKAQLEKRARNVAIRRSAGESITAKQADNILQTGFIKEDIVSEEEIGSFVYQKRVDGGGNVSYTRLSVSEKARHNAHSEGIAESKLVIQQREAGEKAYNQIFKDRASTALSRAMVTRNTTNGDTGKTSKTDKLGEFNSQEDFGTDAMIFVKNNADLINKYFGFDPTSHKLDAGQQLMLEDVMVAYARSLNTSKDSAGRKFSNAGDFSAFINNSSAQSGLYLLRGEMYSVTKAVNQAMSNNPNLNEEELRQQFSQQFASRAGIKPSA